MTTFLVRSGLNNCYQTGTEWKAPRPRPVDASGGVACTAHPSHRVEPSTPRRHPAVPIGTTRRSLAPSFLAEYDVVTTLRGCNLRVSRRNFSVIRSLSKLVHHSTSKYPRSKLCETSTLSAVIADTRRGGNARLCISPGDTGIDWMWGLRLHHYKVQGYASD